jgi:hypothetical protein
VFDLAAGSCAVEVTVLDAAEGLFSSFKVCSGKAVSLELPPGDNSYQVRCDCSGISATAGLPPPAGNFTVKAGISEQISLPAWQSLKAEEP